MAMNGKITLVSSKGTGCCKEVTVAKNMTAREVIFAEFEITDPDNYLITVQGKNVDDPSKCILKSGDFVIITPKNVKGS